MQNRRLLINIDNFLSMLFDDDSSEFAVGFSCATVLSHQRRRKYVESLCTVGADVVIAALDHIYERIEQDGIIYFVNGLGGCSMNSLRTPVPGSQVRYNANFGAMFIVTEVFPERSIRSYGSLFFWNDLIQRKVKFCNITVIF